MTRQTLVAEGQGSKKQNKLLLPVTPGTKKPGQQANMLMRKRKAW